jgi:OCT family organic cation transporter-like MFS transporter 4/5
MPLFIGNVFGFIFFTFFADNFGRRFTLIMTLMIANIGIFLIVFSSSIDILSLGLFLAGAGL